MSAPAEPSSGFAAGETVEVRRSGRSPERMTVTLATTSALYVETPASAERFVRDAGRWVDESGEPVRVESV